MKPYFPLLLVSFFFLSLNAAEVIQPRVRKVGEPVDYNFHVKPILSDRCFACHGPDEASRDSGFRLDERVDTLKNLAEGKEPDRFPI